MTSSELQKRFLDGHWAAGTTGKGEQKSPDGGAVQEDPGSIKECTIVPWYRKASTLGETNSAGGTGSERRYVLSRNP